MLRELTLYPLDTTADELRTNPSWTEARANLDWSDTMRFALIVQNPAHSTATQINQFTARRDEFSELDELSITRPQKLISSVAPVDFRG